MKAKIWFLFLSLCGILSACGNDGITYVTTDSFLNKNSISDVRYLAVSDLQVGENEILYYGARKDLDWFALFDKSSGLLLKEWYGQRLSIAIPDGDVALIGGFTYRGKKFKSGKIAFYYDSFLVLLSDNQKVEYGVLRNESSLLMFLDEDRYYYKNYEVCDFEGNTIVKDVQYIDSFYIGFQEDKLWLGYYDGNGLFKEISSLDVFERNRSFHLGYGEYKDVHIDGIGVNSSIHKYKCGYILVPTYYDFNQHLDFHCDVIFLNEQDNQLYVSSIPYSNSGNYSIQDWYEDTILLWEYDDPLFVFTTKGELIAEFDKVDYPHYDVDNLYPVNYNEGVALGRRVSRWNLNDHTSIWETTIDKLNDFSSDARITFTLKEQNGTAWLVLCNVVNKDGSKNEFTFTLNIETGEITYTD